MYFAKSSYKGFTLVELVVVIVVLGILAATALPKFVNIATEARVASIQALAGSVQTSLPIIYAKTTLANTPTTGVVFVTLNDGTNVRIWNGYPDHWCDGIGVLQQGLVVPSGGCYFSTAPIAYNNFTFYGFTNTKIPNGDAGWRIENAPNPQQCAVGYHHDGVNVPVVITYTSGC